jgi:hypothetical protein
VPVLFSFFTVHLPVSLFWSLVGRPSFVEFRLVHSTPKILQAFEEPIRELVAHETTSFLSCPSAPFKTRDD